MKKLLLLAVLPLVISCNGQKKTDLSQSNLNEPIVQMINFGDDLQIGTETVEYPYSLLIEVKNSEKYSFNGIDLKGQKIIFQINSEKLKTDSITRFGGGHVDLKPLKNGNDLNEILKKFKAENKIYGVRIEMKSQSLKTEIVKKIQSKYGKGQKNPNTDNGLYWNIKNENKFIFFAPDYDRLIILNNESLSKTCYWDTFNGFIDFGGCENEKYMQQLLVNSTKPENVKNKPTIKINKSWNINGLVLGKTNEDELLRSGIKNNIERTEEINGSTGDVNQIIYQDDYHDVYFYLSADKKNPQNKTANTIKGYALNDFKKVDISFESGLKTGMKFEDAIKLFDKKLIINYNDLKFSNYIEIKNDDYKVTLNFDENMLFSGMYVN